MPDVLKGKITAFTPSQEAYYKARHEVLNNYRSSDINDAAWYALIVNRLAFSGIPYANAMSDPSCRWNAKTLCKRIDAIHEKADHMHISCMDACEYIQDKYWLPNSTLFIDPPYYEKGSTLYHCYYNDGQHRELSYSLDELYKSFPCNDMIITYDNSPAILDMYNYPQKYTISRKYSIAN